MARDYKHSKRGRKGTSPALAPFAAGLAAGLAVAVLVHLYHAGKDAAAGPGRAAEPVPASAEEAAEPVPEEAEYTFYDLLPKYEVVVPEAPKDRPGASREPAAMPPGTYILQAGSFRRFEDADRQKARLALLGISSTIKKVTIDDEYTTHRVQIGPVSDPRELASLRARLADAGIPYLAMKARDSG